jgi:hypothetical protein
MRVSKKLREAVSPSLCVHTKWRDFGKPADEKNVGGIGSSRWSPGYQRRETVENSTALSVKDFYRTGVLKKANGGSHRIWWRKCGMTAGDFG